MINRDVEIHHSDRPVEERRDHVVVAADRAECSGPYRAK